MTNIDNRPAVTALFNNIKKNLGDLLLLQEKCEEEWGAEDGIYRFYHVSFKTYRLQDLTSEIVRQLRLLHPKPNTRQQGYPLNSYFEEIISKGTEYPFRLEHNENWLLWTRPILEAYFHAKHVLDIVIKYGELLDAPPTLLPSGWATVLYIYNLR